MAVGTAENGRNRFRSAALADEQTGSECGPRAAGTPANRAGNTRTVETVTIAPVERCAHCGHALCGAHLLRELTFVIEANGYRWAANIKRLLPETCARVAERPDQGRPASAYKNLCQRYI